MVKKTEENQKGKMPPHSSHLCERDNLHIHNKYGTTITTRRVKGIITARGKEREEGRESKEEGQREGGRVMGTGGGIADGVCAQGIMSALDRRFSFP